MSDIEVSERAKEAVRLACLAAGDPTKGGWRQRVQEVLPTFAALVRDDYGYWGREAQGVLDASVFTAKFLSYELEPTSQRLVVQIETKPSKNYPDGIEPIRTERMNTPPGVVMRNRLSGLAPGTAIVIWKRIDVSESGDRKFRVLVHFEEVLKSQSADVPPSRPAPAPPADGAPRATPSPARPSAGGHSEAIAQNMEELSNAQKIKVRKACTAAGIDNWMNPSVDDVDKVLVIIQNIRKESS